MSVRWQAGVIATVSSPDSPSVCPPVRSAVRPSVAPSVDHQSCELSRSIGPPTCPNTTTTTKHAETRYLRISLAAAKNSRVEGGGAGGGGGGVGGGGNFSVSLCFTCTALRLINCKNKRAKSACKIHRERERESEWEREREMKGRTARDSPVVNAINFKVIFSRPRIIYGKILGCPK